MKKLFLITAVGMLISSSCFSQNEVDALRYSQITFGGTARYNSMAGAFGALGGDFSVLSTNPAGIAIYKRSELTFTPSFFNQKTNSNYKGNSMDDYKYNVNFGNAGIVLSYYESETKNAWKGVMFGFGYNRLNNFNQRILMGGKNDKSSLLDVYLDDATATGDFNDFDQFSTGLAWNTWLIDYDSTNGNYFHVLPNHGENQSKSVTSNGSMGETVFTLGGNYSDKLYIGGTFGIPNIRYEEESNYEESIENDSLYGFKSFQLNEHLNTNGVGFNFKFGMIYRPIDWVRIGGALHSPTYYNMHDSWGSEMESHFTNDNYTSTSPTGIFDYKLVTPMRTIGSIGFVINKVGLVGVDYEFVDYPSASLNSANYKFLNENKAIREKYMESNNVRIGTEWRLHPVSLRGGFAYYGSPFKRGAGNDGSKINYTAGIGFREDNFFLDFAYVLTQSRDNYYFYDATLVEPSVNNSTSSSVMMTLGFKF